MKTKTSVLALMISIFTQSAPSFGGGEKGNGGDAVVCRNTDKAILTAESLDRYEARELREIEPSFPAGITDVNGYVTAITQRLQPYSPLRREEYQANAVAFEMEAKFSRGKTFEDIPDSEHMFYPVGCGVEQVIVQITPVFPEDKRYNVNLDIWERLSAMDQAILIAHEVMLREMKQNPPREIQTRELRYFNSLLFSGKISSYSLEEFNGLPSKIPSLTYIEHPDVVGRIPRNIFASTTDLGFAFNPDYRPGYFQRKIKGFEGIFVDTSLPGKRSYYLAGINELKSYPLQSGHTLLEFYSDESNALHVRLDKRNGASSVVRDESGTIQFTHVLFGTTLEFHSCKIAVHDPLGQPLFVSGLYSQETKQITSLTVYNETSWESSIHIQCEDQTRIVKLPTLTHYVVPQEGEL